jgi:O-Antigen ligase
MEGASESSVRALGKAPLILAIAVGVGLLGATFAGDGSDVGGILPVGGWALVVLAAAFVAVGFGVLPVPRIGWSGLAAVGSLALLCLWIGASVEWSITPDRSWDAFNRSLVFLAFLGLGVVLAAATGALAARVAATVLSVVTGAVLVAALMSKVIPALDPEGDRVARLRSPVEYWNALALVANIALVLGLWLAASREHRLVARIAGGLLLYVATLALLLTISRAGVVAGIAVVVLWFVLSRGRMAGALLLAASALPAVLVAGWAFTRPALVEDVAERSDRVADGAVLGVLALAGAGLVAALVWLAVTRPLSEAVRKRVLVVVAVIMAVGALSGLVLVVGNAETSRTPCAELVNDPTRLGSFDFSNRTCWWDEALEVFGEHAPLGAGAGTFEIARRRHREDGRSVSQPHNVALQHLADGGVAGIALFVAFVAAAGAACVCATRRLEGPERAAGIALVAAPAAYLLHSLVDYSWDFLAVTAPTMVALGVLAGAARPPGELRRLPALAVGVVVVAVVVLVSFTAPRLADRSVRASTRALEERDYDGARDQAERGRSLNPYSLEPIAALARIAERQGEVREAQARYADAVELQPENPETWYALGLYEFEVIRDLCAAHEYLERAFVLDPVGNQWVAGGPLDVARAAVDDGVCGARPRG